MPRRPNTGASPIPVTMLPPTWAQGSPGIRAGGTGSRRTLASELTPHKLLYWVAPQKLSLGWAGVSCRGHGEAP